MSTDLRHPAQTVRDALSAAIGTLERASRETIFGRLDGGASIFLAGAADGH